MADKIPRLVIAGTSSGSGKTTVVCAILTALKKRGIAISAFKCGPDFIDPMFHEKAIGIPSKNLDSFFCNEELLKALFYKQAGSSQISVVEGVMGYYDGIAMDKYLGSTYHIAKIINAPVVLVVNARGMALTCASLIKGIMDFKKDSNIKGIILNNVSKAVYTALKPVIEGELNVSVIGYMPRSEDLSLESRHLGLVTPENIKDITKKLIRLGEIAEECIDMKSLIAAANSAVPLQVKPLPVNKAKKRVKIAIARDAAFCFYYKDNIELLKELGGEIVYFSPLKDKKLPEADGLVLGGGYPELYCRELSENKAMLSDINKKLNEGLPCLAECGGFMYLHNTIEDTNGKAFKMVGFINGNALYRGKLVRFGYIAITDNVSKEEVKAHEFHYWDSTNNGTDFSAVKPNGSNWQCMHRYKNVVCGFPHIFYYSNTDFAEAFVSRCISFKENT